MVRDCFEITKTVCALRTTPVVYNNILIIFSIKIITKETKTAHAMTYNIFKNKN